MPDGRPVEGDGVRIGALHRLALVYRRLRCVEPGYDSTHYTLLGGGDTDHVFNWLVFHLMVCIFSTGVRP